MPSHQSLDVDSSGVMLGEGGPSVEAVPGEGLSSEL